MAPEALGNEESPASVFDALPFPALIVDDDVRLLAVNPAAMRLLGAGSGTALRMRGGEALHCINSGAGCGKSPSCSDCVIRGAVTFATTSRQPVRRRATLESVASGNVQEMHALITASPVLHQASPRILLVIEDLAPLLASTDILPICMGCRRVRNDDLWEQIEAYMETHLDLKFSHGLCPECSKRLYPDHEKPAP